MRSASRLLLPSVVLALSVVILTSGLQPAGRPSAPVPAAPVAKAGVPWPVEDVRRGMKGYGKTVLQGTKLQTFQVEVLGVLRNTSPGRDLVLARLSGMNLEKSGVIAGMSGSPVYIDGRLLGAVAYAWPFGKEPIAGITPFVQMQSFVDACERRETAMNKAPVRVGLADPVHAEGREFKTVAVSHDSDQARPASTDALWLVPLRTPLTATGFSANSLRLLQAKTRSWGLIPVQGGAAPAKLSAEERRTVLEPGGSLAVSLITGDFDLSGIGTVTHVEGNRVYGWGHPFMSLGGCQLPMFTGYIHTIYPRQTVSFKMGSPLRNVGVMNADVSTAVAGWIGRKVDMLPVRMTVSLNKNESKTFNVRVARHGNLLASLVYTSLTNSVDMEGELPEYLTARFTARIELEGRQPIIIKDTFSGFSGGRAPQALYGQVAQAVVALNYNGFENLRITRIECDTVIVPGRETAEIESAELDAPVYAPGDTVTATVWLRPHLGKLEKVRVAVRLPDDLTEGSHSLIVCDGAASAKQDVRLDPALSNPSNVEGVLEGLRRQTTAKRTELALRLPLGTHGVSSGGQSLPDLPDSMVKIFNDRRRSGVQPLARARVAKQKTPYVIQGSETVRFEVRKVRPGPGAD